MTSRRATKPSSTVAEARAVAQRAKLDAQTEARQRQSASTTPAPKSSRSRKGQEDLLTRRRAATTVERAIVDFLDDHEGGNHSAKTLEWHRTALGLFRRFLAEARSITLVGEIDVPDLSAWFAFMRKTPTTRGGIRSERTIQTYARSVGAFFHWLVRRETIERNPFDRVVFPKVGKPLIRTISPEEFERRLVACTPPNEAGPIVTRAVVRNRAILSFRGAPSGCGCSFRLRWKRRTPPTREQVPTQRPRGSGLEGGDARHWGWRLQAPLP